MRRDFIPGVVEPLEPRKLLASSVAAPEFRVNTHVKSIQNNPATAVAPSGAFVVVWESYQQDGSKGGIYAQRYTAKGTRRGGEFRVNTYTAGNQISPAVAIDATDFVVVWESQSQHGIYGQRYSAAGAKEGSEFRISGDSSSHVSNPAISAASDGQFIATYDVLSADGTDADVYARRFDQFGIAIGDEFRINSSTDGIHSSSSVAMDKDGDFVISWIWNGKIDEDSISAVYVRRFNSNATPHEAEFTAAQSTPPDPDEEFPFSTSYSTPVVALDNQGDFLVSWEALTLDEFEGDQFVDLEATLFDAQRTEHRLSVGGASVLNGFLDHSVAMNDDGEFIVCWFKRQMDEAPEFKFTEFNRAGTALGSGQVNAAKRVSNISPAAGIDADGDFVIAWEGSTSDAPQIGDIYARIFPDQRPFATLEEGTLILRGTENNDSIRLSEKGKKIAAELNGVGLAFSRSKVDQIEVIAREGNDLITVAGDVMAVSISAGAGDDRVNGGDFNDTINGGAGRDRIDGGDGNDLLSGGKRRDTLIGGRGNDRLQSKDSLIDLLNGGDGDDTSTADGNDLIDQVEHLL